MYLLYLLALTVLASRKEASPATEMPLAPRLSNSKWAMQLTRAARYYYINGQIAVIKPA
jgi:hypothetical protein